MIKSLINTIWVKALNKRTDPYPYVDEIPIEERLEYIKHLLKAHGYEETLNPSNKGFMFVEENKKLYLIVHYRKLRAFTKALNPFGHYFALIYFSYCPFAHTITRIGYVMVFDVFEVINHAFAKLGIERKTGKLVGVGSGYPESIKVLIKHLSLNKFISPKPIEGLRCKEDYNFVYPYKWKYMWKRRYYVCYPENTQD